MRADRRQHEPSLARVDVVGEGRGGELGLSGRGLEDTFPGRLRDAETVRVAGAGVEVLEARQHLRHRVPDPVVVVGVGLPRRLRIGQRRLRHVGEDRALRALAR